jgi:hypothetical protein
MKFALIDDLKILATKGATDIERAKGKEQYLICN